MLTLLETSAAPSIQKPAHVLPSTDNDFIPVNRDNSFTVKPKFKIGEEVLVLKTQTITTVKTYTFEAIGDPQKCGLTLVFVTKDGDRFYHDELRSTSTLGECRMCEEPTVYRRRCVVCGWENHPGRMPAEEFQHPSMSAAERNGHYGPAFRK